MSALAIVAALVLIAGITVPCKKVAEKRQHTLASCTDDDCGFCERHRKRMLAEWNTPRDR